jgi:hypothetical protein
MSIMYEVLWSLSGALVVGIVFTAGMIVGVLYSAACKDCGCQRD